jgi:DNA gyrase/topoisomerase IV subunit A
LISPDKIDEWVREVEERPGSAELIIRYIARRLSELVARDEELAAQNIELLSGRKVEEYESRIASLEYQLALLKRQLGGEVVLPIEVPERETPREMINLLLFNPLGQVLRLEIDPNQLVHGETIAKIVGEVNNLPLELLITGPQEELLFIFDTGRTVRRPATQLPIGEAGQVDWQKAFIEEPHIKEELAAIQPIGKMPLFEQCIQASRRGYVKKMKTSFFTAHLEGDYIGSGVKLRADKTCGLTFGNLDDLFVMVSQEGFIFSTQVEKLPTAIEEVIQLGIRDHIVSAFVVGRKPALVFVTQNGKAVHRESGWLEPASSFKLRGQAILSKERREAGVLIVGAAAVEETDWGVVLQADGKLIAYQVDKILAAGSVLSSQPGVVRGIAIFHTPEAKK